MKKTLKNRLQMTKKQVKVTMKKNIQKGKNTLVPKMQIKVLARECKLCVQSDDVLTKANLTVQDLVRVRRFQEAWSKACAKYYKVVQ